MSSTCREKMRLAQVKLLSPMSGLVAIQQNRRQLHVRACRLPDIREGDQVQPGMPVADVLDLSELEVVAKVGELDRANLKEGQDVSIHLDAVADHKFTGKIKWMSGTASANVFSSDPAKKFDVIFSIDMKQLLSALGAKPDQIAKVLATAEQNRQKPIPASGGMSMMMMAGGGAPGSAPGGAAGYDGRPSRGRGCRGRIPGWRCGRPGARAGPAGREARAVVAAGREEAVAKAAGAAQVVEAAGCSRRWASSPRKTAPKRAKRFRRRSTAEACGT